MSQLVSSLSTLAFILLGWYFFTEARRSDKVRREWERDLIERLKSRLPTPGIPVVEITPVDRGANHVPPAKGVN